MPTPRAYYEMLPDRLASLGIDLEEDPRTLAELGILVDGSGGLTLVDWDDAGIGISLLDVGYVVAHLCTFLPGDRARWGVRGSGEIVWRPDWALSFLDDKEVQPVGGNGA